MKTILGGTFDPVHIGHLRMALELAQRLSMDDAPARVDLMPCYGAVHKPGVNATAQQRLDMLQLAIKDEPLLGVDTREILRQSPSYTVDSLREMRAELGSAPINLVIGSDNLEQLPRWKEAEAYAGLCNLIVVVRPGFPVLDAGFHPRLGFTLVATINALNASECGRMSVVDINGLDVSSRYLRQCLATGRSIRYLVTDAVRNYICDNALYFF